MCWLKNPSCGNSNPFASHSFSILNIAILASSNGVSSSINNSSFVFDPSAAVLFIYSYRLATTFIIACSEQIFFAISKLGPVPLDLSPSMVVSRVCICCSCITPGGRGGLSVYSYLTLRPTISDNILCGGLGATSCFRLLFSILCLCSLVRGGGFGFITVLFGRNSGPPLPLRPPLSLCSLP